MIVLRNKNFVGPVGEILGVSEEEAREQREALNEKKEAFKEKVGELCPAVKFMPV